jgi:hypothetical protein
MPPLLKETKKGRAPVQRSPFTVSLKNPYQLRIAIREYLIGKTVEE